MKSKASHATDRSSIQQLVQIVNVGEATAEDLQLLGINRPQQLIAQDPWELYRRLCVETQILHDPCVLDVFMAAIDYMNGSPPKKWWEYTDQRKSEYGENLQRFSPVLVG